jgi:limonene-1,2-epoxide hydrolase
VNLSDGPAEIITHFQQAWNTHDMNAFGRLFHPDATFVNRFVSYWRGSIGTVSPLRCLFAKKAGVAHCQTLSVTFKLTYLPAAYWT